MGVRFGVFDETTDMWVEKNLSEFTVCRPERLRCTWEDYGEADEAVAAWQKEIGPDHRLWCKEVVIPSEYDEGNIRHPVRLNEDVEFPHEVTWEDLETFLPTSEGSTRPRVGKINGIRYVAKFDFNTSYEHVMNEIVADAFLRAAGLRAPASRWYYVPQSGDKEGAHIRLAQYLDGCVALEDIHEYLPYWNWEVKKQVVDAYPVVALMANVDAFHNDNVLVDRRGRVWFVDNGASFGFRAQGEKKSKSSGFSYEWETRRQCLASAKSGGMMGIYEYSKQLQKLLGSFTVSDVRRAIWRGPDLRELARGLPGEQQCEALLAYAEDMMDSAEPSVGYDGTFHAWKYAWKFYDGAGQCPYDSGKDPTAAFFWNVERDVERVEGREQVVEWLFNTTRPEDWPRFMREVSATRDELAIVLYAYETELRIRYGNPHSAMAHNCFGVEEPKIDWRRYFDKRGVA